jgi:isoleucyl-tRNA synthetase
MNAKLQVRQPLSGVTVILNDDRDQAWLEAHEELLKTELNVQNVCYTTDAGEYVTYQIVPNFKRLGPRVGKLMPKVKQAFSEANGAEILAELRQNGKAELIVAGEPIALDSDDVEVRLQANEGWAAAQGKQAVVVLSTELTPELIRAGLARGVNRMVQERRKEMDLERTDRLDLYLYTESSELKQAIEENRDYLVGETLATHLRLERPAKKIEVVEREVGDHKVEIYVRVAS